MLLWVIIKTTDNGAKCLLTGLAIILCNQDRWEHYKLQINPFNNEGPRCARPVASIVARAARARAVLQQVLCELWLLDETLHERETRFDFEQNKRKNNSRSCRAAGPPKQAKRATALSRIHPSSSALWEHAYSACLTRTNDGPPSAYMLTAVSCPHPGNDCVINPELLFKLLLTAEGENGINCLCSPVTNAPRRTVWAIRHCQRQTWEGAWDCTCKDRWAASRNPVTEPFIIVHAANHFTVCVQKVGSSLRPADQPSLAPCPIGGQLAETIGSTHSFLFHHPG